MTATPQTSPPPLAHGPDKAITLALRLAHAEQALQEFASDQVDAIVDSDGNAHLLRQAQEHLLRSERRLRAMVECVADVLTVVSRGGLILSQGQAVKPVLGYAPEELVGKMFFDFVHPDDLPQIHSAFFNVIEGIHAQATAQFRHRTGDGSHRLVEATTGLLRDAPPRVVFCIRAITGPLPERSRISASSMNAGEPDAAGIYLAVKPRAAKPLQTNIA
jgi:PAS domain S-box-containing protein